MVRNVQIDIFVQLSNTPHLLIYFILISSFTRHIRMVITQTLSKGFLLGLGFVRLGFGYR